MFKTIVAHDGSEFSDLGVEWVKRLPRAAAGEVVIVTSVAPPNVGTGIVDGFLGFAVTDTVQTLHRTQLEAAQAFLDRANGALQSAGIRVRSELLIGEAVSEILHVVDRENADLVVAGSRGVGAFEAFVLGSVAKELVNRAPCSVLVARPGPDHDPSQAIERLRSKTKPSAAIGYDGSPGSKCAMDFVRDEGTGAFAKLFAVCAEPTGVLPGGIEPAEFVRAYEDDHEQVVSIAKQGERDLEGLADLVEGAHAIGRPTDVLSSLANQQGLDLLVLGATRHGFLERLLVGSVSADVAARAPCSVLIVRPPKPTTEA
jgi:nucleotide-binding universal stress UspA family protein